MTGLGAGAAFDVTFTCEKHGPGDATMFPGYWEGDQRHTFTQHTFMRVFGCTERGVRKAAAKAMTDPLVHRLSVDPVAVNCTYSVEVHRSQYKRGMRNTLNPMQSWLFGWDK